MTLIRGGLRRDLIDFGKDGSPFLMMNFSRMKEATVILVFLCAAGIMYLMPVSDSDVFWHLATGKWIAEHRELPKADPFAHTTPPDEQNEPFRTKLILSRYWLANIVQYSSFSLAGYYGIIGLRMLIMLLTFLVIGLHLREKGLDVLTIILLLLPLLFVLTQFSGDRPNQMTFLFVAVYFYIADGLRQGRKRGYLLPLVILLWANVHGGFLLGVAITVCMGASVLIRKMLQQDYQVSGRFLAVLLVTFGAGFLNPNGYMDLYAMFYESPSSYTGYVFETQSPFLQAKKGDPEFLMIFGTALLIATCFFIWRFFSLAQGLREKVANMLDDVLVVAFSVGLSFSGVRYIPLFIILLIPVAAPLFAGKLQSALRKLSTYLLPEMLITAFLVWSAYSVYPSTAVNRPVVDSYFPSDAVEFIKKNQLPGRFYNFYDWGGYLIWRFYPEKFVFIDGRAISMDVFSAYRAIEQKPLQDFMGLPVYKALLDAYNVRNILIPPVYADGQMLPILKPLLEDPDWHLVFAGPNSLIFTRETAHTAYPKLFAYNAALESLGYLGIDHESPASYLTRAKVYSYTGNRGAATALLEEALRKWPSLEGSSIRSALDLLTEGREIPVNMF